MIKEQFKPGDKVQHQKKPRAHHHDAKILGVIERDGKRFYRIVMDQRVLTAEERQLG